LNGVQPLPASPATVAKFVSDIAELGIERVFEEVQQIGRSHYVIDVADPTLSGPVAVAMNEISKIKPPRSWLGPLQQRFLTLPWDIQKQIAERETEREQVVRRAQNEAAEAKRQLEKVTNGQNDTVPA
jgi:hypothetical protein